MALAYWILWWKPALKLFTAFNKDTEKKNGRDNVRNFVIYSPKRFLTENLCSSRSQFQEMSLFAFSPQEMLTSLIPYKKLHNEAGVNCILIQILNTNILCSYTIFFVRRALQLLDVFCTVPISVLGIPQKGQSARPETCLKGNKRYWYIQKDPSHSRWSNRYRKLKCLFQEQNRIQVLLLYGRDPLKTLYQLCKNKVFLTDRCGSVSW